MWGRERKGNLLLYFNLVTFFWARQKEKRGSSHASACPATGSPRRQSSAPRRQGTCRCHHLPRAAVQDTACASTGEDCHPRRCDTTPSSPSGAGQGACTRFLSLSSHSPPSAAPSWNCTTAARSRSSFTASTTEAAAAVPPPPSPRPRFPHRTRRVCASASAEAPSATRRARSKPPLPLSLPSPPSPPPPPPPPLFLSRRRTT